MKQKFIALAACLVMISAVFAGCAAHKTQTALPAPRTGVVGVLDREAEQIRAFFSRNSGKTAGNTTTRTAYEVKHDDTLSARHLTALIGLPDRDVRNTLGTVRTEGLPIDNSYHETVYGARSDVYVHYDDHNVVNKVVVTVDQDDAARWRRELNALYGIQITDNAASATHWLDKNAQINWTQTGDKVRITITGKTV